MKLRALFLVLLLLVTDKAHAASPVMLMGSWAEKFSDNTSIVTVFTETTMESYALNAKGKRSSSESNLIKVTYNDLGENKLRVDFDGGEGITVEFNSLNDVTLDYSGAVSHDLTRLKAAK